MVTYVDYVVFEKAQLTGISLAQILAGPVSRNVAGKEVELDLE